MKDEYDNLDEIIKDANRYAVHISPSRASVILVKEGYEKQEHFSVIDDTIFYKFEKGKYRKVYLENMKSALIPVLSEKLEVEDFMNDVLSEMSPNDLIDVYERAIEKKGNIDQKNGCYFLRIGGKRGRPKEIFLR